MYPMGAQMNPTRGRSLRRGNACLLAASLLTLAACNAGQAGRPDIVKQEEAAAAQAKQEQSTIERGKYLAAVGGCNDCHTPLKMGSSGPEPDMSRYLSGHPQDLTMPPPPALSAPWMWVGSATNTAFQGPWGTSYAINLTPDQETGIGLWSEQVFINALKTGRHMGVGRPIMPPMPWQAYAQMTDEDIKALFAYLKSVEALKNQAPESVVAEPPPSPPPSVPPAAGPGQ
jgi:mono/diheme cytochrome c family protein